MVLQHTSKGAGEGIFPKKKKRKVVAICNLTTSKPRNPTHWTFNIREVFVILKGPVVKTQKTAQIKSGELIFKDFYSQRCQIMINTSLLYLTLYFTFFFTFAAYILTHISVLSTPYVFKTDSLVLMRLRRIIMHDR